MSSKSALAVVLVLTLPTVLVLSHASAQDVVPVAPTVPWVNQVGMLQTLYLTYPDANSGQPICTQEPTGSVDGPTLAIEPVDAGTAGRAPCNYVAGISNAGGQGGLSTPNGATFSFHNGVNERGLLHGFNVTGNTSLNYLHVGDIPTGVDVLVELRNGDVAIAHATIHGDDDKHSFSTFLSFQDPNARSATFVSGKDVNLALSGTTGVGSDPTALPTGTQWTVSDTGSRLEIRSTDAVKAATWTQDEAGQIRTLFRPLAKDVVPANGVTPRIVGAFAVQSAFGYDDARGKRDPTFTVEKGGAPVAFGPDRISSLTGALNRSASQDTDGRAVWNFPAGFLDYRGLDAGEYNVSVDMPYHQGSAVKSGIRAGFLITTQSVLLTPYDDSDPTTNPSPLETGAHELPTGGQTTYILLLNNTGAVNDTFTLTASQVSASPSGWAASIGGPGVLDRTVRVAPGEAKLIKIGVVPPPGAPIGSTSIFQVTATSGVDPTARTQPIILTSTITANVRHEVGIIGPVVAPTLDPSTELHFPVNVWNRGTRPANVSLEIRSVPVGWSAQIAQGDNGVSRLVIPNVQPGDLATADVRVTGPPNTPDGTFSVGLNATDLDVGGVSTDAAVNILQRSLASVKVQILESVGTLQHTVELTGNFSDGRNDPTGSAPTASPGCGTGVTTPRPVGCVDDGLDGTWVRVWVSNTGQRSDAFDLTTDSLTRSKMRNGCTEHALAVNSNGRPFGFYTRSQNGVANGINTVNLQPGQTAEVYVWVPEERHANPCIDDVRGIDFIEFVVDARGRATGAEARDLATVIAQDVNEADNPGATAVRLEHVTRLDGYTNDHPLVDISNSNKRLLLGGIEPNGTRTYKVRLTHAGSWSTFVGSRNTPVDSNVQLVMFNVDREHGWNVSIRPVLPDLNILQNPYSDNITLQNQHNNLREGWYDQEIEVVVQAPSSLNASALAGESNEVVLHAFANASSSTRFDDIAIKTIIVDQANVTVVADQEHVLAHPGELGVYLLYVNNSGSSNATVKLTAAMDPAGTPNPAAWTPDPAVQTFSIAAFKNRTVALTVRAPAGASVGTTGVTNVTVSYARDPFAPLALSNKSISLVTEVAARGTLALSASQTLQEIPQGGFANFSLVLRNTGAQTVPFQILGTPVPNWTQQISPITGSLQPGESRTVVEVLKAPLDVTDGSSFSSILRVSEFGNDANFDVVPLTVNIRGGAAIPALSPLKSIKTVDRAGVQSFEVNVKNLGSKAEKMLLSVRSGDPTWLAYVQDQRGNNISSITLQPNDLQTINVTVRPPFLVAEHTIVPIELTAEAPSLAARTTLQAQIHDYGVRLTLQPPRIDLIAGLPTEFTIHLTNEGNDNDTLNVSANLADTPEWTVQLAVDRVRLEPGQSNDIRAVVRSPTQPLPSAHAYTLKFYGGTVGGQAVNLSKNDSIAATVNILPYRPVDVDRDDLLELAVDADGNPANGFEKFQEIFADGLTSVVVSTGKLNGRATFFLDVPRDGRSHDGEADVWFDPDALYAYDIKYAGDVNGDNSPDYMLDTDRDGKVDKAYDAVSGSFWGVVEIHAFGTDRVQFLVDTSGDGRADRFFDPDSKIVTRTQSVGDPNLVGIDTKNNGRVDKIYDVKANSVSDAKVYGIVDFTKQYWYFFLAFIVLAIVTVALLVRRRRA